MNYSHEKGNISSSPFPQKKPGRNLLCEILIFGLVYVVCTIGNFLVSILFLECFLPLFSESSSMASSGDPMEFAASVLANPYMTISMLYGTAATIVIVLLFCRFIQKRSWASVGLSRQHAFAHYARGILFGVITISFAVAVCAVTGAGLFEDINPAPVSTLLLFLLAYLIQGASEEILCRGYFMSSIARRYPIWLSVVVNSLFFAFLHCQNSGVSVIAFVNLFLFGVFASLLTIQTGSIWCASGFHSIWNFFQGNIYGIKVSGIDMHGSLLHFISDPSKSHLNGGDFGIEGSYLCTIILTVSIFSLLYQCHKNKLDKS